MKSTIIITTIALTTLLITSCASDQKNATTNDSKPVKVILNTTTKDASKSTLNTSGKIEASKSAILSTRIMGYVEKMNFKVGDKVTEN